MDGTEQLIEELRLGDTIANDLMKFLEHCPNGVMGEDFYGGISSRHEVANYLLTRLIDNGFMVYRDPDYPEDLIEYNFRLIRTFESLFDNKFRIR